MPAASASATPNDPWSLATSASYDIDTFYTRASDEKGHSNLMHVPVSTNLYGQIRALVEGSSVKEYRTNADVVRDALVHRLRYLQDNMAGDVNAAAIDEEMLEADADKMTAQIERWDRLISKVDNLLDKLIAVRDADSAWHVIASNEDVDYMTEPYALRMTAVLDRHRRRLQEFATRLPVVEDVPYSPVVPIRRAR